MSKVLTVDIGNSNIVAGVFLGKKLIFTGRIETKRDYTVSKLGKAFNEMLADLDMEEGFDGSIISSVVPEITEKTIQVLEKLTGKKPLLMGAFLDTGVDVSDYAAGSLGTDRIVDLAAAISMYKDTPVMVCDLGTCTTFTVADEEGKLVGGAICAGVQLSLDAQAMRASQLPELKAEGVMHVLGKDTASNMLSGAVAGTGIMITGMADAVQQEKDFDDLRLVVTGGLGKYVMPWIKRNVVFEPDLLLKGLYAIYCANSDRSL